MRVALAISASACLVLPACHARIEGGKVLPNDYGTCGIRYSLPKVVLRVHQNADGTVKVEKEFLPDLDNTYAIQASTLMGKHAFDVDLENGLLKRVRYNPDTTAVLSEAAGLGGAVAGKIVDTQIDEAKARRASAEKSADATRTERAKLKSAVDAALKELRGLQAKLAELELRGADTAAIRTVQVEIAVATSNLVFAQEQLAAFEEEQGAEGAAPSGNAAGLPASGNTMATSPLASAPPTGQPPPSAAPPPQATASTPAGVPAPLFLAVDEPGGCQTAGPSLVPARFPDGSTQRRYRSPVLTTPPSGSPPIPSLRSVDGLAVILPAPRDVLVATREWERATAELEALKAVQAQIGAQPVKSQEIKVAISAAALVDAKKPRIELQATTALESITSVKLSLTENGPGVPGVALTLVTPVRAVLTVPVGTAAGIYLCSVRATRRPKPDAAPEEVGVQSFHVEVRPPP